MRLRFPTNKTEQRLFRWNLFTIGIPIILQLVLMAAINATDGIMLGFLSQDTLSAVSLTNNFVMIFSMTLSAVSVGMGILVSQYWGKRDKEAVKNVFALGMKYAYSIGIVFFIIGMLFPSQVMTFYTNDPELIRLGSIYMRAVSIAFLLDPLGQIYSYIMINLGHVARSTFFSILSAVINVILNVLLIFGLFGLPKLGIIGAAVASVISIAVRSVLYLIEMIKDGFASGLLRRILTLKSQYSKVFREQTMPVLLQRLSWVLADAVLTAYSGHMGSDVVAAKAIISFVYMLTVSVGAGFRDAVNVVIGNDLGRGSLKQAQRKGRWIFIISIFVGVMDFILTYVLGKLLMLAPFDFSDNARELCRLILLYYSINIMFHAPNNMLNGCLYAGGETKYLFWVDTICSWVVLVGIGGILIYLVKVPVAVGLAVILCSEVISFPFKYWGFKKEKWVKNLTEENS